jgi:capsular exopolysaccharide synthesis family protein
MDAEQAELAGGKVTAGVPLARFLERRLRSAPELVVLSRPSSDGASRFRDLCARLEENGATAPRTILVTSPGETEGRSIVAVNLALAWAARQPDQVVLVEADLRRPSLASRIEPQPVVGLAELLAEQTELEHVLIEVSGFPIHVLPAGEPPGEPVRLLASDALGGLMGLLADRYRRIVIDTPPIVPYTDADLVGRFGDGVLIVARAGRTRRGQLVQALGSVTSAPLLGVLLNDFDG